MLLASNDVQQCPWSQPTFHPITVKDVLSCRRKMKKLIQVTQLVHTRIINSSSISGFQTPSIFHCGALLKRKVKIQLTVLASYCILHYHFFSFSQNWSYCSSAEFCKYKLSLQGNKTIVLNWWEKEKAPLSGVGSPAGHANSLAQQRRGGHLANNTGSQNKLPYFVLI